MTIIPHILLPTTQILAISLPPFRYRASVFAPLIVFLAVWGYSDLSSKQPTTQLPLDIVILLFSQWPWYLGTLEKLLFSVPERDYWRLDQQRQEALNLSWCAKLRWAVALYCSPRGVGWNYRVKGVPPYTGPKSRLGFILQQLGWLTVCAVGIDAMGIYTRGYYFGEKVWGRDGVTSYSSNWGRSGVNALHGLLTPYLGLNIAYSQVAIVFVGFGDKPENWPPLYGNIQDATTLRRFWNTWWHQCLRKMYTGYSQQVVKALGFSRGSWQSRYTQLYFTFILSATGHAMVMYGLPHASNHTMWDRWWSFWLCFACQAFAIQAEDTVIWLWRKMMDEGAGSKKWQRLVGRLWVAGWCWLISVLMVDPGLKLGTYHMNPLPFGILEPLLDYVGLKKALFAVIFSDS